MLQLCSAQSLSHVRLFATLWTVACQAPLSMGFSRQEYWSGLPCPLQGIFPIQGWNPGLPHCRQILYHLSYQGSPGFSCIGLFQSQISVTSKFVYHTTYPTIVEIKSEFPYFFPKVELKTCLQACIFYYLILFTVLPHRESLSLPVCFRDNLFQAFEKSSTINYSFFFKPFFSPFSLNIFNL